MPGSRCMSSLMSRLPACTLSRAVGVLCGGRRCTHELAWPVAGEGGGGGKGGARSRRGEGPPRSHSHCLEAQRGAAEQRGRAVARAGRGGGPAPARRRGRQGRRRGRGGGPRARGALDGRRSREGGSRDGGPGDVGPPDDVPPRDERDTCARTWLHPALLGRDRETAYCVEQGEPQIGA